MSNFFTNLVSIGHIPTDSPELKVKKSFLVFVAAFMSCGGLIWGSISIFYGLVFQSFIPYGYVVISIFNMIIFGTTKNFKLVRSIQVFISLLLPFLFQWSLGGFFSSGLIMLWAILALVASPSFQDGRSSIIWFLLFTAGTGISYWYDDYFITLKPAILPDQSLVFLVLNTIVISGIVYGLVLYYVRRSYNAQKEVRLSNAKLKKVYSQLKEKNMELELAKKELLDSNSELSLAKENLTRITEKQQKINEMLLQDKGYLKGDQEKR